jgi:hypothetical protein
MLDDLVPAEPRVTEQARAEHGSGPLWGWSLIRM